MGIGNFIKIAGVALSVGLFASAANAVTYTFSSVSNNLAGDVAIGEAQLSLEVLDAGGGIVSFTFANAGPSASSITELYWDDSTSVLSAFRNPTPFTYSGAGLAFSIGATPPNLPSGNTATPAFSADFAADSDSPEPHNGVNPGESVTAYFTYNSSFDSVIAALDNSDLRVGIHVTAFASRGSESFMNNPPSVVPVPAALPLMLSAFGIGAFVTRKRRKAKAA